MTHGPISVLLPDRKVGADWPTWRARLEAAQGFVGVALEDDGLWRIRVWPATDAATVLRSYFDSRIPPRPERRAWKQW